MNSSPWARVTVSPSLARGHFLGWDRYDPARWAIQLKLDGERRVCQILKPNGREVAYFTGRRKNTVGTYEERGANLPHLRFAFEGWDGAILDGEVFIPGGNSSDVTSILATKDPLEAAAKIAALPAPPHYGIFDIIAAPGRIYLTRYSQQEREGRLAELIRKIGLPRYACQLRSEQAAFSYQGFYEWMVAEGKEGVVLKDRTAAYVYGPNGSWVKVKPVRTITGMVRALQQGEGKYSETLGALLYVANTGERSFAGAVSGMTDDERDKIWANPGKYIGRKFDIEYAREGDASLIHPRFVRWREDL